MTTRNVSDEEKKGRRSSPRAGKGKESGKSVRETAYAYLASRIRTVEEVRRHLKDRGYEADEIQETINDLIGLRYLDDYQYALRYYEYNREKKRSSGRAARELAERGVDAETIRNAREDFMYSNSVDEYADALAIAVRELELMPGGGPKSGLDDRLAAKIARKLDGRGFDRGDIFKVLDELRRRYPCG